MLRFDLIWRLIWASTRKKNRREECACETRYAPPALPTFPIQYGRYLGTLGWMGIKVGDAEKILVARWGGTNRAAASVYYDRGDCNMSKASGESLPFSVRTRRGCWPTAIAGSGSFVAEIYCKIEIFEQCLCLFNYV